MIITVESRFPEVDPDFKVQAVERGVHRCNGQLQECIKIKPDQVRLLGFPKYVVKAVTHDDGYVYMPVSTASSQILFW